MKTRIPKRRQRKLKPESEKASRQLNMRIRADRLEHYETFAGEKTLSRLITEVMDRHTGFSPAPNTL